MDADVHGPLSAHTILILLDVSWAQLLVVLYRLVCTWVWESTGMAMSHMGVADLQCRSTLTSHIILSLHLLFLLCTEDSPTWLWGGPPLSSLHVTWRCHTDGYC